MSDSKTRTFPSIRADMGIWTYYITTLTFEEVAAFIKRPREIKETDELRNWLQREIDEHRLEGISNYLLEQQQHFFNAIVVGIYGGEPQWYPVSVSRSPTLGDIEISERAKISMGVLSLSGEEEAFPIDGQHRVEAIKQAIQKRESLTKDEQCIIFVAHKKTKAGHEQTRRLFSTLNRYARPVSKGEIIALDQDDAFAIVTRKLVEEYPSLEMRKFTAFTKTTNLPPNENTAITTVLALYDLVKTIALPRTTAGNLERNRLIIGPPKEDRIKAIYNGHIEFWDTLKKHVPEIKATTSSRKAAGTYRKSNGGHVLFRPVGQVAFANAVRILMDRNYEMETAVEALSKLPLKLDEPPWRDVLWNPDREVVISGNNVLAQNLFLFMLEHDPLPKNYKLEERYRKALGDNKANLKDLIP
jgi:DNA sulfur modification protein DndB